MMINFFLRYKAEILRPELLQQIVFMSKHLYNYKLYADLNFITKNKLYYVIERIDTERTLIDIRKSAMAASIWVKGKEQANILELRLQNRLIFI